MSTEFNSLKKELSTIEKLAKNKGANGFFAQEVLRFISITGTLLESNSFLLDESSTINERYLTHILTRSLLENFFTIIYLFDNPVEISNRYEKIKNSFKNDYRKLLNEVNLPHKDKLEPFDSTWQNLPSLPNVNDMLMQVQNHQGDRLNYLYFVYRITSFDTHGRNLENIFTAVFEKKCNFPILKIKFTFELIANEYRNILNSIYKSNQT